MKYFKFLIILFTAAMLTGCQSFGKMSLDNTSENGGSIENKQQEKNVDPDQVIQLLRDYSDFYLAMTPSDNEKFIDRSRNISIDGTGPLGNAYTSEYYKTVGLPANTLDELNEKLDGFVTDKAKDDFLEMTNDKFFSVAENGDLYMTADPFGRGLGLGMGELYLDSIEYPDDDTITITVTSIGDDNVTDTASAKLVRTDGGLRISEYDANMIDYFGYYDEISFDKIPQ